MKRKRKTTVVYAVEEEALTKYRDFTTLTGYRYFTTKAEAMDFARGEGGLVSRVSIPWSIPRAAAVALLNEDGWYETWEDLEDFPKVVAHG